MMAALLPSVCGKSRDPTMQTYLKFRRKNFWLRWQRECEAGMYSGINNTLRIHPLFSEDEERFLCLIGHRRLNAIPHGRQITMRDQYRRFRQRMFGSRCDAETDTRPRLADPSLIIVRSRNPVQCFARDAVLSEQQAQLGGMFLDVAHVI